jgi:hypothetical protein
MQGTLEGADQQAISQTCFRDAATAIFTYRWQSFSTPSNLIKGPSKFPLCD